MASLFENVVASLFGNGKNPQEEMKIQDPVESFAPPTLDGATTVEFNKINFSYELDPSQSTNEIELIRRYRDISIIPEVAFAIDEIINECICQNEDGDIVTLFTDDLPYSSTLKNKIQDEFSEMLRQIDFDSKSYDLIRRWYIDGRLYFHKIVDSKIGLREARYISPITIKKIVEVDKKKKNGVEIVSQKNEYFTYQASRKLANISIVDGVSGGSLTAPGYSGSSNLGMAEQLVKVSPQAIAYVTSGVFDEEYNCILSYLHPALKTATNLRVLEDSVVLYRLARAPERRVFYVDIGNLPQQKADQYMKDLMNKFRANLTYDTLTGEVKDSKRNMSMLEDFWIPRRGDGKNTEITTLESAANLGEIDDLELFRKKLYMALNVPQSRMQTDTPMIGGIGRSSEITRDEIKFQKFITRIRNKFSTLLIDLFATHLEVKKILATKDVEQFKQDIGIEWSKDSFFVEMKETEILRERLTTLQMADMYMGKYFSKEYIMRDVLQMNDEQYDEMVKQMDKEHEETPQNIDPVTGQPIPSGFSDQTTGMANAGDSNFPPPGQPVEQPDDKQN